jgi:hypothetical protein
MLPNSGVLDQQVQLPVYLAAAGAHPALLMHAASSVA